MKSTQSEETLHLESLAFLGGEEFYPATSFCKIGVERNGIFVKCYISCSTIANKSQFTLNLAVVIN